METAVLKEQREEESAMGMSKSILLDVNVSTGVDL